MARSVRLEYAGAFYHIMARGNRRQAIFRDEEDRRFFLHALAQACARTGWRVQAWVLMGNHYHLFLHTPEPNLVAGMGWLQNAYTRRFNTRHREWGRLFGDRYKAIPVEDHEASRADYYPALLDYIHLNPVRAALVKLDRGEDLLDYPWSSLAAGYARPVAQRAPWLEAERGLRAFGCQDSVAGRKQFVARLEARAAEEPRRRCGVPTAGEKDARRSHLRRGWYWGSQAFAEKLLGLLEGKLAGGALNRNYRAAKQHQAHDRKEAERLLSEGLKEAGLTREDLAALPGSDPRKVALAQRLWRTTTASQSWIAEVLAMRSAANVSQILRRARVSP